MGLGFSCLYKNVPTNHFKCTSRNVEISALTRELCRSVTGLECRMLQQHAFVAFLLALAAHASKRRQRHIESSRSRRDICYIPNLSTTIHTVIVYWCVRHVYHLASRSDKLLQISRPHAIYEIAKRMLLFSWRVHVAARLGARVGVLGR